MNLCDREDCDTCEQHKAERDKHAVHFTSAKTGTGSDTWTTPRWLFDFLDREFGPFALDAAANAQNALCADFYDGSEGKNGLVAPWRGNVWCNPPYSNLNLWLPRGLEQVRSGVATRSTMLIPARTDTKAFQAVAPHSVVFFLKGRLKFGDSKNSAPFPSAVIVFDRELPPSCHFVDWRAP